MRRKKRDTINLKVTFGITLFYVILQVRLTDLYSESGIIYSILTILSTSIATLLYLLTCRRNKLNLKIAIFMSILNIVFIIDMLLKYF